MSIYRGKSVDGSDMEEMDGAYISPNGKYWGSEPISRKKEQEFDRFTEHRESYKTKKVQRRNNDKYR